MDVSPTVLDKEIERAARALTLGKRALSRSRVDGRGDPLAEHRLVSSRTTFQELSESGPRAPPEPLRSALRAWVAFFTLERVLWEDSMRIAAAWRAETIEIERPEAMRISPRALLLRILGEPVSERRRALAGELARGSGAVADATRIRAERRSEAQRRLGNVDADTLELPCDPPAELTAIASELLNRTDAIARTTFEEVHVWSDVVPVWVGHRAVSGWPAHLVSRWLEDLFRGSRLTEGLTLDLGPLPSALGATSFGRALAQFGAAYAETDVPRGVPFALTRAPFDLRRARRGALFGALVADPLFGVRSLGLNRSTARDQAREIARGLLLTLRLDAVRVLSRAELLRSARERGERLEELTARALGAPIPGSLSGVLPRIEGGHAARFAGALLAARDRESLVERFDEDWWKSPHAAHALREEQAQVAKTPVTTKVELGAGLDALDRAFTALLS